MANLPISRLISVDVNLEPSAAQSQDLSTLLLLGTSDVIDVVERLRTYSSIDEVAQDFGNSAPEYLAAVLWFEQAPQPTQIKIGRWALSPTSGKLICAPLSVANSAIGAWQAISNGGFTVSVNGVPQILNNINFNAVNNLNAVATAINGVLVGAVCTYNSVYNRFEFESVTDGVGSAISFLTGAGGQDISGMLNGVAGTSGAYVADGINAETALAAAQLFDEQFGQTWYALTIVAGAVDADHVAVSGFIEATNNKHIYGISTQEAGVLSSVSTTDIAYLIKQLGYKRTITQYSSSNAYSVCSALGRGLTVDYNGQNTVITLMYKQEPGIVAESLTTSQVDILEGKNCNVFVAYNNNTAILEPGVMASGNFFDEITGSDWLAVTIMTDVYNVLLTSPTKIPQTDAGNHILVTAIEAVCSQGVLNGLLAPGTWNSQGFGSLNTGDLLAKGFYVFAPPIASQNAQDRAARKSVPIQVAAKLAGAVHTVDITINVNR